MFSLIVHHWAAIATACGATIIAAAAYCFSVSTFGKWRMLGVPYVPPVPLFGNFLSVATGYAHPVDLYRKIYHRLAGHRYGGFFQMRTPYLMVRDPDMINDVLIKDFAYFTDRGIYSDFSANPLSNQLFFMRNPQWRTMRNKLSPAFTSGKLKLMYEQIKACGDELMRDVRARLAAVSDGQMDVRDVLGNYSMDVIGTCAFGLRLNAVSDADSEFRRYGKTIFKPSLRILLRELCLMVAPALLQIVKLKDFPSDAVAFFRSAFRETIVYRERHRDVARNDFVQILMRARDDLVLDENVPPTERFTESQIVANAFVMFAAGFETVSTAISFCLHELALKKRIQDRVREEIKLNKSKHNGAVNNEFLLDLNYLDTVLSETLRKYPPTFALFREATKTYRVPGESLIIDRGQKLIIPIYSLHYDPRYFPDPEMFDPDRFTPDEVAKRPKGTYLPFGDGPRICIGKRFAELEMKLALVEILSTFEVEPCEKTTIPVPFSKGTITVVPEGGIWLKFKKI